MFTSFRNLFATEGSPLRTARRVRLSIASLRSTPRSGKKDRKSYGARDSEGLARAGSRSFRRVRRTCARVDELAREVGELPREVGELLREVDELPRQVDEPARESVELAREIVELRREIAEPAPQSVDLPRRATNPAAGSPESRRTPPTSRGRSSKSCRGSASCERGSRAEPETATKRVPGGVAEWSKAPVLKTGEGLRPPRVRISSPPPERRR